VPWDGLGDDIADAFSGTNLLFYGGAVAVTGAMAYSGGDQGVRVAVQRNLVVPAFGDGASYAGYILPAIVPPVVYVAGLVTRDRDVVAAGCAALQALGIELLFTSIVKVGVGRPYPLNGGDPNAPDRLDHPEYARQFRPFGSAWPLPAWPSGHTSATTAVAAALAASYPDRVWVAVVGYSIALTIGFGLVDGDRHWTSDAIAGALVGHAIGYSVGSAFRRRTKDATGASTGLEVVPLLGPGLLGAAVGRAW
jgi:membrane-associated phospholipid phosphatase